MRNAFVAVAMAVGLIGLGGCDDSSGDGSTSGSSGSTGGGTTAATTTGGSSTGSSSGGSTTGGTTGGSTTGGSSSGTTGGTTGTGGVVDSRDGHSYATVVIGAQTWLGENMDYATSTGSACYDNDPTNCAANGRLYTFSAAGQACPAGWHLPSDDEWKTLETTLGMAANQLDIDGEVTARGTNQGTALKEGGSSGFEAKLAGYGTGSSFYWQGTDSFFWTSTLSGSQIWRRHVSGSSPYLYRFQNPPASFAISVRCIQ